ncbi:MAG: ABC transporter substrate-binding protein, partial [Acidimicrobiales bacterium]
MRSARFRFIAVATTLGVLALTAACSRSGDSTSTEGQSGGASTTVASSGAPGNGQFGTITDPVCGPAPSGGSAASSGGTQIGLTADTITLGVISDVGYSGAPGLNQELFDASDVFASWCNSLGGINGRQVKIDKLDAKITEYKQRIQEACERDFALVGGGGVFDDAGQTDRLSCLLPDFPGYVVTNIARGADLQVQATPGSNTEVQAGIFRYLKETFPDSIAKTGFLTGNIATTINNKAQYQEAAQSFGYQTVYDERYNPVGEPTWTPFAQAIKDKGVKGLYFVGSAAPLAQLVASLAQIDYKLDWVAAAGNQYDQALLDSAGSALDTNTVYIQDGTTPFLATDVPA